MHKVDLLVIGSGPAGQRAAIQGTKLGKSVVVVEKKASMGGFVLGGWPALRIQGDRSPLRRRHRPCWAIEK